MLYNEAQYNEQPYQYFGLSEFISLADNHSLSATKALMDTVFLGDFLVRAVTNKTLDETINLNDWVRNKRTNSNWED